MAKADQVAGNAVAAFGGVIVLAVIGAILFGLFSLFSGCGAIFHADTPEEKQAKTDKEFAAHPGYEADMNALAAHLADNGVQASWPGGYGDSKQSDAIYVSLSPSDSNSAAPALAERVYQRMIAVRQKDGYGDQAAACFVHVLDAGSSTELAVDRMGRVDQ